MCIPFLMLTPFAPCFLLRVPPFCFSSVWFKFLTIFPLYPLSLFPFSFTLQSSCLELFCSQSPCSHLSLSSFLSPDPSSISSFLALLSSFKFSISSSSFKLSSLLSFTFSPLISLKFSFLSFGFSPSSFFKFSPSSLFLLPLESSLILLSLVLPFSSSIIYTYDKAVQQI